MEASPSFLASSLVLSLSLCLPPTPTSTPLLPLHLSLSLSLPSFTKKQDHALFGALLLSAALILRSRNSQNQSSHLARSRCPPPPPFVLSALSIVGGGGEGGGVGKVGVLVQPVENCPSDSSIYVTEQRSSHQRNIQWGTKTPASTHPRSSSERLACRLAERKKRLNFFFLFLATPRRSADSRACFCQPMPQVNAHARQQN